MRTALAAAALLAAGCQCVAPRRDPPPRNQPPVITVVDIAEWPPLGPDDEVRVEVTDADGNLESVVLDFARQVWRDVSGSSATVSVRGSELGEGFGTLAISTADERRSWSGRVVDRLLVDLTPPQVVVGPTVVRADGEGDGGALRVWIGDAWIVAGAELRFQDTVLTHVLPEGRPWTLGTEWDWSLVTFEGDALPPGAGTAELEVFDAAGNVTTELLELVVDDSAPSVRVLSPAAGALLSGRFAVELEASDEGGGPLWIELYGGGALLATAAGPRASVELDTAELPRGTIDLVAIAIDLAGYESAPDQVTVQLVD